MKKIRFFRIAFVETVRSGFWNGLVEGAFDGRSGRKPVRDAIVALEKGDVALAKKVVAGDAQVNRQEVELDHACAQLIVRRQPAANDLRNVMATVKVISDLERMGDEATKIARSVGYIVSRDLLTPDHYHAVINMSHTAKHMMHEALDAYARMDTAKAAALMATDDFSGYGIPRYHVRADPVHAERTGVGRGGSQPVANGQGDRKNRRPCHQYRRVHHLCGGWKRCPSYRLPIARGQHVALS